MCLNSPLNTPSQLQLELDVIMQQQEHQQQEHQQQLKQLQEEHNQSMTASSAAAAAAAQRQAAEVERLEREAHSAGKHRVARDTCTAVCCGCVTR